MPGTGFSNEEKKKPQYLCITKYTFYNAKIIAVFVDYNLILFGPVPPSKEASLALGE